MRDFRVGIKNAELEADFEYDEKSLIHRKSCLLALKCRNYVLFHPLELCTNVLSPLTFFV
jgi:hypothetical protein